MEEATYPTGGNPFVVTYRHSSSALFKVMRLSSVGCANESWLTSDEKTKELLRPDGGSTDGLKTLIKNSITVAMAEEDAEILRNNLSPEGGAHRFQIESSIHVPVVDNFVVPPKPQVKAKGKQKKAKKNKKNKKKVKQKDLEAHR